MSDTDDTDSLLSVAAPSGLTNFLGLSVEEISSRINSLTSNSNTFNNNSNSSNTSRALTQEEVRRAESVKHDILSQLAEYSDSEGDLDDAKSDSGSEVSTASTNSITMLYPSEAKEEHLNRITNFPSSVEETLSTENNSIVVPRCSPSSSSNKYRNYQDFEDTQRDIMTFQNFRNDSFPNTQQVVVSGPLDDKYKLPTYGVRVSHGIDFLRQSPHTTGWRYTTAYSDDPQIIQRAPNFRTPGGYKPPLNPNPPRDLTDTELHEEVKQMYNEKYTFPDSDDENQSSSAINNSKVSEIVKVEQNPTEEGGGGNKGNYADIDSQVIQNDKESPLKTDEPKSNTTVNVVDTPADSVDNVPHGVKESTIVGMGGKPVKRKLFSAGDLPGGTVGSIPDLGFGLRDLASLPVREETIVPSQAWLSDINHEQSRNRKYDKPYTSSAQFRDENNIEISPIKAAFLENSKNSPDIIARCLPRARQLKKNHISTPKKVSLLELDLLWKDIQRTKSAMEEEMSKDSARMKAVASTLEPINSSNTEVESLENKFNRIKVNFQEEANKSSPKLESVPSPRRSSLSSALEGLSIVDPDNSQKQKNRHQQKSILKSKSGVKKSSSARVSLPSTSKQPQSNYISDNNISFDLNSTADDITMMSSFYESSSIGLPTDLDTIDFSSILSAAHIKPSEFDDILSRLDDFSDVAIEQMNVADEEIEDVVTKLEVTDWAKSGATEYVEKYYDEKNRRQLCETENCNLNKIVLKLKEELAVRSKTLKSKDNVLLKMTKAWQDITTRWKVHEKQSREILHNLQKDHASLLESSKKSKQRIDGYEKELASAIDLADTFKCKLEALERANYEDMEKLGGENYALREKFVHLEDTLNDIKVEKDVAVRALGESQKQLDERDVIHQELQERITFVELESKEGQKDFMKILEQKTTLEEYLQNVTAQKDSLETHVVEISDKLKTEVSEKERLLSQMKEEQEYYKLKIQQQSEDALAKEVVIVNNHQQELMALEKNLLKILEDCKKSCYTEMSQKQRRYEKEIRSLREELAQKQHFITKMSREFYEQTDKEIDQSIFGRVRIGMKKVSSSAMDRPSEKDNVEASICSSNESLINQKITQKYGRTNKEDDDISSVDDFNPSKLGKYNVSTPTSGLITPTTTTFTTTTKMKRWHELPNIQHLLTPRKDESPRAFSIVSSATIGPSDKENRFAPSAITPSRKVYDNESIPSIHHDKLHGASESTVSEQRIRKCIQTLVKVYSNRLNNDVSDGKVENKNIYETNDTHSTITQIKSVAYQTISPLATTKIIQQKDLQQDERSPCSEPPTNDLNRKNSMISYPTNYTSVKINYREQEKQPLKPPWK